MSTEPTPSQTPETDNIWLETGKAIARGTAQPPVWEKMKELERERDRLRKALREIAKQELADD